VALTNGNGVARPSCWHGANPSINPSDQAALELLRYWNLLWGRRWLIVGVTLAIALSVAVVTRFCCQKWYRAEAVITPLGPGEEADSGLETSPFGEVAGISALFGMGAAGDNVVTAERFITIMESYAFGIELIQRHALASILLARGSTPAAVPTPWRLHLLLNGRFDSEYDYRTGDLTLYFTDSDRAAARQVLEFYLQSLRDRLRSEAVRAASTAAASLDQEVRQTPDVLLQSQLSELMARQIQREKLAQVQADFAFKIVEPPVVPDHYYAPIARTRAALSGFIVIVLMSGLIVAREWLAGAAAFLAAQDGQPCAIPAPAVRLTAEDAAAQGKQPGDGSNGAGDAHPKAQAIGASQLKANGTIGESA